MRRLFEVNSEPHTGARPSVRLCVGLIKDSHTHTQHKGCLAPALETSKTADVEKSDIPMTQIGDEVKVVGEDRLESNF